MAPPGQKVVQFVSADQAGPKKSRHQLSALDSGVTSCFRSLAQISSATDCSLEFLYQGVFLIATGINLEPCFLLCFRGPTSIFHTGEVLWVALSRLVPGSCLKLTQFREEGFTPPTFFSNTPRTVDSDTGPSVLILQTAGVCSATEY